LGYCAANRDGPRTWAASNASLVKLSDDIYEQAVLEGGAVDFIDKTRGLPILLKRL
jgi:hypothetical protein